MPRLNQAFQIPPAATQRSQASCAFPPSSLNHGSGRVGGNVDARAKVKKSASSPSVSMHFPAGGNARPVAAQFAGDDEMLQPAGV
jgi:hypothetical protein